MAQRTTDLPSSVKRHDSDDARSPGGLRACGDERKIEVRNLNVFFGGVHVLKEVSIDISEYCITAFVGASGSGKSTFLRTLNRLHDRTAQARVTGNVLLDGEDIYTGGRSVVHLHQQVGMVFQRPNPFPMSVFENVAYGLRLQSTYTHREMRELVERALQRVALWDEVKDRLRQSALCLSEGQQQRLCLARTLAVEPEVILMDEPCFALDHHAAHKLEELIGQLKRHYTIIVTSSNPNIARRIADTTGVFFAGTLIEWGPTSQMFSQSRDWRTEAFITGRLG